MGLDRPPRTARVIPLLIVVCFIVVPVQAQYSGGSGIADDPYQIATAADLIALGQTPDDYDKHFILTADIDLAAGQYVVVVKDQQAFAAQYGTDINIAGQYSGSLDNSGERIRLEDAIGQTILDFEYSDSWYSSTDGKGYSLTIIDEVNTDPNSWSEEHSWQPSASRGGSPG